MALRGMDIEEVERLVGQLEFQAKAINAVVGVVDTVVSALTSVWFGADLQRFHGTWQGNQRAQAHAAAVDIEDALAILRREIAEQRRTSGGGGGGSGRGPGLFPAPGWMITAGGLISGGVGQVRVGFGNPAVGLISGTKDLVEGGLRMRLDKLPGTMTDDAMGKLLVPSKTLRTIDNLLGPIGAVFDVMTIAEGVQENDNGKLATGTIGTVLFGISRVPFLQPVAGAGAIALAGGSMVLPTNNQEYDGAFEMAVRREFGVGSGELTPSQAQHMVHRYEGLVGYLRTVSDGMDYKFDQFLETTGLADGYHQAQRDFRNAVTDAATTVNKTVNDIGQGVSHAAEQAGKAAGDFVGGVGRFFGIG